jgi:hypothetical protein
MSPWWQQVERHLPRGDLPSSGGRLRHAAWNIDRNLSGGKDSGVGNVKQRAFFLATQDKILIFLPCIESVIIVRATIDHVKGLRARLVFSFAAELIAIDEMPESVSTSEAVLFGGELIDASISWASGAGFSPPRISLGFLDLVEAGLGEAFVRAFEAAFRQTMGTSAAPMVRNAWLDALRAVISSS